ncbi:hypothetical protein ACLKA7_009678 [Drosophila subpalustris]
MGLDPDTMLCSNDNTPMCARSRREYLLFKNECDLRKAQRENLMDGPLFDVALQNCVPSCEFECNDGFQPICGVCVASGERKTFRNRCEMARTSCYSKSDWLVYKWGVCPTSNSQSKQSAHTVLVGQRKRRRPVPCTNVYRPVCASYAGVKSTFSNECLVNAENIRTGRNWRVISEGLCGEDSIKMKHNRKNKPNLKLKPKVEMDRSKRSHKQLNQLDDDFEMSEDAVQIFAPSTFHTQFISNSGTMERSYSLPARTPEVSAMSKARSIFGSPIKGRNAQMHTRETDSSTQASEKACVFSNQPVCGSFNGESRTFANVCALMEYSQAVGNAWTILYDGNCRRCDKTCPTVYSPICANRNGISYTIVNECYLDRVRCKDPSSDWKIAHKGECTNLNGEVSQSVPKPSQKPLSRIPSMLYEPKKENRGSNLHTTTPRPRTKTPLPRPLKTTSMPRRKFKKLRRPTPTPKDLSNRKIRKIESVAFDSDEPNVSSWDLQPIQLPASSKLRAAKDNWLMPQNLDDVKNKFNKKPNWKKEMYPLYRWTMTATAPTQLQFTPAAAAATTTASTTTASTATTLNTLGGITNAELLNFNLKSVDTDSENPFDVGTTAKAAAGSIETEATTRSSTTSATSSAPTEAVTSLPSTCNPSTSHTTTESTAATITTTEVVVPVMYETTTMLTTTIEPEASTSIASTIIDEGTTKEIDRSTAKEAVETTAATTAAATSTKANEMSTMSNLDYTEDDDLLKQREQTSIYGLDKNSLIMRLLRARSSKNMVI